MTPRAISLGVDINVDSAVGEPIYPELRTSRKPLTFVILGILALGLGGGIAFLVGGGGGSTDAETAPVDDRAGKPDEAMGSDAPEVPETVPTVETKASSAVPTQPSYAARRDAARKATRRRRNVLAAILLA